MLKLKRFSEGVWFDYPEGGRLKIRPLSPKDYLTLREKSRKGKVAVKKYDGSSEIVDDYDESQFFWSTFCYMLEDWQDIEEEGRTKDQVREDIFNNKGLRDFITEKANESYLNEQIKFEDELKNLKPSQSGSTNGQ